ncbi:MAG: hypothetical protein NVSMB47_18470 [Polyangiales bacterium]
MHANHSSKQPRRALRRSRVSERGAALTEAVVAIPFFLIMFAGIMFVGTMYETKLRVMRLAKESAWDYAMCNCGEAGDEPSSKCRTPEGTSASSGGSESGSPSGYDPSAISKVGSGPSGGVASKSFGSSQASMEASITADGFLGGYTKKMSSRTKVMCNEAPHDGSLTGWGTAAFDSLTKW